MSIHVMSEVWKRFEGGGSQLLTMLALADWADDDGSNIYPSVGTLARKVRLTNRRVQKLLRELESAEWITTVNRSSGGPQSATNLYKINVEKLLHTPVTGDTGDARDTGDGGDADPCHQGHPPPDARDTQSISDPSLSTKHTQCPHQDIVDLYHNLLPMCQKVRVWSDKRKKFLRARWKEDSERQSIDWWKKFFTYVAESKFLTGQVQNQNGKPPFLANLEWLIIPANFVNVIEGKYHRE